MNESAKIQVVKQAITVLNQGGVILYPTDTIWGVGCDPTNKTAIDKIYSIKKRSNKKPLIILIHDEELLLNYVKSVPNAAKKIIKEDKVPTTIIYENPINLPNVFIKHKTIGIRVVKKHCINMLLSHFGKALTSTSANISNSINPLFFEDIDDDIKNAVDYIIPKTFIELKAMNKASRIIKINTDETIDVIRN
jgi:L-threonylcarbamoyladenylate synthase